MGVALGLVAMPLVVTALYASHLVFDVQLKGNVTLTFSTADPLKVFSGDGVTPLASGDAIDFGTAEVDVWGTIATRPKRVVVRNTSNTRELVIVTGDGGSNIVPVFGTTKAHLKVAPDNQFTLEPTGFSGDTVEGWVGLNFLAPATGSFSATIVFSATAIGLPPLPDKITFEDPSLGNLCRFSDAGPLRDEYLMSHGVVFRGAPPTSPHGLAALHECSNLGGVGSHVTGDYFLAGISTATMANSGVPWLPEVITFIHPVSEVWFYGCSCGSGTGYTLSLQGYDGPDATGALIAIESKLTTTDWQLWRITAPEDSPFSSVKLSGPAGSHTLVIDDLEWRWVE